MNYNDGQYIVQTPTALRLQTDENYRRFHFRVGSESDENLQFKFGFGKIFFCNESAIYTIQVGNS